MQIGGAMQLAGRSVSLGKSLLQVGEVLTIVISLCR